MTSNKLNKQMQYHQDNIQIRENADEKEEFEEDDLQKLQRRKKDRKVCRGWGAASMILCVLLCTHNKN